jgi:diguanylate cyclase (GGDEF)-like protein
MSPEPRRRLVQRGRGQATLREVLNRAHLRVTLIATALAGLSVLLTGAVVIRTYTLHNLQLTGQAASYTSEAAVVFDDRLAVREALAPIIAAEGIASVSVTRADGALLWDWQRERRSPADRLENWAGRWIFPAPVVTPILHEGRMIGEVRLRGNPSGLFRFLAIGSGGALLCMMLVAILSSLLSRRLRHAIVEPLQTLADIAHAVRIERTFDRIVPPSSIREISALTDDFNALLAELRKWDDGLRNENESLTRLAMYDSLTGLPNRAHFEKRLERAVRRAGEAGERLAVLFLDSNHFKEINDKHGHAAGDAVLIQVAARIRAELGENGLVARLGGDEFAILLAPLPSVEAAQALIDRIMGSMAAPIAVPGDVSLVTSLSIGMACFPDPCGDEESLLRTADQAMYQAKRARQPSGEEGEAPVATKGSSL